jgi:Activator of Hsp90 ATPase homolog 1-like protein
MITVNYSISINAPAEIVYNKMLEKATYEIWTSAFNPTSTFEGSWEKGSKILFIGINSDGKKEGMVSEIAENIPNQYVSILHKGMLNGDVEITSGTEVDEWAGVTENYTFEEEDGITKLTVNLKIPENYKETFDAMWQNALEKLKEICED